jgi:hypothetical protein
MHPDPDTSMSFARSTAHMLADPRWVPAHALLLAGFALMVPGVLSIVRDESLSGTVRKIARVALAGAVLSVVEAVFHLASASEATALAKGGSAPIVQIHLQLARIAFPLIGVSIAALAIVGARSRAMTHPLVATIGVVGGLMHGLSAPIVVTSQNQHFSVLFMGGALMAIWLVAVGVTGLVSRKAKALAVAGG